MTVLTAILDRQEQVRLESQSKLEAAVESLKNQNVLAEVGQRHADLDKRERERHIRIGTYQNIIIKSHATDLFDIEMGLEDVLDSASLACPGIAAQLRQVMTQDDD